MSCSREEAAKDCSSAFAPAMKRELLPLAEVLAHRRRHGHDRLQRVGALRLPRAGGLVERLGLRREVAREGHHGVRVGHRLAEGHLAVAVEVGLDPLRLEVRVRAEQRGLREEEEVAGLLEHLAAGQLDVERHGVLGVRAVGARVDDHVELGELGHARDDALHLLVARVGLAPRRLHVAHGRADVGAALVEQRGVVEARALGQRAIRLALAGQLPGRGDEVAGVIEQVGLDRPEVLAGGGRGLRGGGLVVLAGAAAGDEDGREQGGEGSWGALGNPNTELGAPNRCSGGGRSARSRSCRAPPGASRPAPARGRSTPDGLDRQRRAARGQARRARRRSAASRAPAR